MPKLAIYIPKKDMRELDRWRKKINFSQVFMTALRREIRDQTRNSSAPSDELARAAVHYRRSLAEEVGSVGDTAYQLGSADVLQCRLTVPVIRSLLELANLETLSADEIESTVEAMGGNEALEAIAEKHGVDDRTDLTWRELACRNYIKGVVDVWAQVRERIRATTD
jgi:hypothetical protein